jgi:formate-dependent nitrite reductase membrane component NrfD
MISGALLIYDLGRPMRFLNMLRVFRPTSPMNMGAWILTMAGGTSTGSVLLHRTVFGKPLGLLAGVFGLGLATYTGVLVANTAVPLWQASRRVLPILFGASAAASLGSVFDIGCDSPSTRAFGNAGRIGELAASLVMEREAGAVEYVARPLKRGWSGLLWRTASLLTASSLLLSFVPRRNKSTRIAAGVCGAAGSLLLRFAVEHAGNQSARDPRATFRSQRHPA